MVLYKGKTIAGGNKDKFLKAASKATEETQKSTKLTLKQIVANDDLGSLGEYQNTLTNAFRLKQLTEDATEKGAVQILTALQIFSEKLGNGDDKTKYTIDSAISEAKALFEENALEVISATISKAFSIGNIPANMQEKLDDLAPSMKDDGEDQVEILESSGIELEDSGEAFSLDIVFKYIQNGDLKVTSLFDSEDAQVTLQKMSDHMEQNVDVLKSSVAMHLMVKCLEYDQNELLLQMYTSFMPFMEEGDLQMLHQVDLAYKSMGNGGFDYGNSIGAEC